MKERFYFMASALTILASTASAVPVQTPQDTAYRPLLEEGKEWHYTSVCWFTDYPDGGYGPGEHFEMLKLEGTTTIDGEEFRILNLYYGPDPDHLTLLWPAAYLKEDTETGKVRVKFHYLDEYTCPLDPLNEIVEEFYNDLVYDFSCTESTYIVDPDFGYDYGEETTLVCNDGVHNGVTILKNGVTSPYSIIEGIGLVGKGRKGSSYLLYYGELFVSSYYSYQWPFLYKVVSGNGDLIYYDESHAPGFASMTPANADSDTPVRVFNLQGMPVKECDGASSPTDGLTPGLYIIRKGDSATKAVIR